MGRSDVACPLCRTPLANDTTICATCQEDLAVLVFLRHHSELLYNEGLRLARAGQLDQARIALEQAVQVDAGNVEALVVLGKVHAKRGEWDASRTALQAALRNHPGHPRALQALSCLDGSRQRTVGGHPHSFNQLTPLQAFAAFVAGALLVWLREQHDRR